MAWRRSVLGCFGWGLGVLAVSAAGEAQAGVRPKECGTTGRSRTSNVWERAKVPTLRKYCDLLASGAAKLVGDSASPGEARAAAKEADKLLAGRAAPLVLMARAELVEAQPALAAGHLEEAKRRDPRALDEPLALLAFARAHAQTGKRAEATQAYRALLPRTSSLSARDRASAFFEAGMAVMALGTEGLEDAVAMFRQARREADDVLEVAATVALALALDRSDLRDEGRAVLEQGVSADVKGRIEDARVASALRRAGLSEEKAALLAMALERRDPQAAKKAWGRYLEGGGRKGPYRAHAELRLAGKPSARPRSGAPRRRAP